MFVTELPVFNTSSVFWYSLPQSPHWLSLQVPPSTQSLPRSPNRMSLPSVATAASPAAGAQKVSIGPSLALKFRNQLSPPEAVLSSAPDDVSVISRNGSFGSYCA
jgi:hypothetical protein